MHGGFRGYAKVVRRLGSPAVAIGSLGRLELMAGLTSIAQREAVVYDVEEGCSGVDYGARSSAGVFTGSWQSKGLGADRRCLFQWGGRAVSSFGIGRSVCLEANQRWFLFCFCCGRSAVQS